MHADRLRFTREPRTTVRFTGTGKRKSTSHSDRTRLPDPVVPGHAYRDVEVVYHLGTRLVGEPETRRGDDDTDG
ncbi:hypothetical protein [Streptomyces griseoaurantiacus]|uniref:Uncharacterized protein n=1 Tax=Streptomyces griseoaurantiacus TaxID=68213 RepID=A0A1G7NS70_9ACTN|nr:hypothetical protein [Streptomyces jietaisiensis]WTI27554.1 hypothetical protein OHA67_15035 [Streptomyces jietaisiensis]SDF76925.1 hypothetical protein SAMN05216260_110291 [Streptomyces jietaisiensis]